MASTVLSGSDILVVDDDQDMRALLSDWLIRAGASVRTAQSGAEAIAELTLRSPDLVMTDLVMESMDGLRLVSEVHRLDPVLPVIMLSAHAGVQDAMRAAHLGVTAFLQKPLKPEDVVASAGAALAASGATGEGSDFAPHIVARSDAMRSLLERARLVARSDCSVLITGATGTGKEVLAQAIHTGGRRRDQALVTVNCSAIPEQLLESELFGHEKGAFTGATSRREGLFQAAHGGTLFLDEIGDMPLPLQAKLLRVLQDFNVRPVGATHPVPIDVRIVSATHHDLEAAVERREFREDLYYRLSVVPLHLADLNDRREDIVPLAERFLTEFAGPDGAGRKRLSPDARTRLAAANLPGNVRQLRNIIEQCTVLATTDVIPLELVDAALRNQPAGIQTFEEATRAFEYRYLLGVLRLANGNVSHAARLAGRNRTEFYKLLNRHELSPADFRDNASEES
ncbi:MAG: sigma 54-interacting transcriptional regulator [Pseudomonadota bacterium]